MSVPRLWLFMLLLTMLTCGVEALAEQSDGSCQSLLPPALQKEIKARYPKWRLMELSDMSSDDAKLWVGRRGEVCPGVAIGDFDGSKLDQYALLLLRKKPRQTVILLYSAKQPTGRYRFATLVQGPTALIPVVFKGDPGDYYEADKGQTPIKIKGDTIIYEIMEAGTEVFYFAGGRIKRLTLSY